MIPRLIARFVFHSDWPLRRIAWKMLHGLVGRLAWRFANPGGPAWGIGLRIDHSHPLWRLNDWVADHWVNWWVERTSLPATVAEVRGGPRHADRCPDCNGRMLDGGSGHSFCAYKQGPGHGPCGMPRARPTLEEAARAVLAAAYLGHDEHYIGIPLNESNGRRRREWDDLRAALESQP